MLYYKINNLLMMFYFLPKIQTLNIINLINEVHLHKKNL